MISIYNLNWRVSFDRNDKLFVSEEIKDGVWSLLNGTNLGNAGTGLNSDVKNSAIHIFLYSETSGRGIASGSTYCMVSGVSDAYTKYIQNNFNDWYFEGEIGHAAIHEVAHCLNLQHPNMTPDGKASATINDGCDDTPSYKELIADGYTKEEIYAWNDHERGSNNVMDYNASQSAWTPNQIERAHKAIESKKNIKHNEFLKSTQTIIETINLENKVVIAQSVIVSNTTVKNGKALYVNCDEFTVTGPFEVEKGAVLDVK